jgi:hypothetical protein
MQTFLGKNLLVDELGNPASRVQGIGAKKLLVLYNTDGDEMVPPTLISNILQAIGLQLDADAWHLGLKPADKLALARWASTNGCEKVIIFGCLPKQVSLKIEHAKNKWLTIGACSLLFTDAVSELESKKELKMALWEALKTY